MHILGIVFGLILVAVAILVMWSKSDDRDWPLG